MNQSREKGEDDGAGRLLCGAQWQAAVVDTVPHDDDVIVLQKAAAILDLVTYFPVLENDHFQVVGPVLGNLMPAIHDQETHVDRVGVGERPDVELLRVDLAVDQ
jgi:hypothetical protein